MIELIIALFILLCIGFLSYLAKNQINIHTSTMAAIMAFGIIIYGVLPSFFGTIFFDSTFAVILLTIVLALWISFWFSLLLSMVQRKWKALHYTNPINRFGIGTWIAASSTCGILMIQYFPYLRTLIIALSAIHLLVWIFYCILSIDAFITIGRKRTDKQVHGILLLTTVSTQSMILFFQTVFPNFPHRLTTTLLVIGLGFYMVSLFFILKRYGTTAWSIETDWNNTNCIVHGALSITGVAGIVSGALTDPILMALWSVTIILFILVEIVEVYRLHRLVKGFGWKEAIGTYDVSQWSRIFTFSMFYTFTALLSFPSSWMSGIQTFIKHIGIAIILALLVYEIALALHHLFKNKEANQVTQKSA